MIECWFRPGAQTMAAIMPLLVLSSPCFATGDQFTNFSVSGFSAGGSMVPETSLHMNILSRRTTVLLKYIIQLYN